MLKLEESGTTYFVGLTGPTVFRLEISYAMVDDGNTLFQLQRATFESFVEQVKSPETIEASDAVQELVRTHPTVFSLLADAEQARQSVLEKEI